MSSTCIKISNPFQTGVVKNQDRSSLKRKRIGTRGIQCQTLENIERKNEEVQEEEHDCIESLKQFLIEEHDLTNDADQSR